MASSSLFKSQRTIPTKDERLEQLYKESVWKNDLILWIIPSTFRDQLPHMVQVSVIIFFDLLGPLHPKTGHTHHLPQHIFDLLVILSLQSWLRCWIACVGLYFGVGGVWVYYTYFAFGAIFFKPGQIPKFGDIFEQMKVAFLSMPLYAVLPAVTEYCVEQGWTLAYARVSDVGLPKYVLYFILYMTSVEFFVYWQHRLLHDIKVGYTSLHHIHHKYNKEHTLSPFAGLAFHPIDGILQAIPYAWTLWFVPMHMLTHEMLLFITSIWTTNIHDCIHGKVAPVMGAGYHTIHHTTYRHNYGHYFTYMDKLFGTLVTPEEYEAKESGKKMQ
jgi:lathosterol oxidase